MTSLMDGMSARHRAHAARFFSRQAWARLRQSGQAAERVVAARVRGARGARAAVFDVDFSERAEGPRRRGPLRRRRARRDDGEEGDAAAGVARVDDLDAAPRRDAG